MQLIFVDQEWAFSDENKNKWTSVICTINGLETCFLGHEFTIMRKVTFEDNKKVHYEPHESNQSLAQRKSWKS